MLSGTLPTRSAPLELVIYRGLPASGKTTLAKAYVAADRDHRARVNRDDLREMLHGGYVSRDVERVVRIARDRLVKAFLDQGVSVACDDTNLPADAVRGLAQLARNAGAHVRVSDLTDVPVELCVLRDLDRGEQGGRSVGEDVIRGMHDRYLAGRKSPLPVPEIARAAPDRAEAYVAKPGTPPAIIVDLDGTLCLHNGRSPYDETRVGEDIPNRAVVDAVRAARAAGFLVVFVSGRSEDCRVASERWIDAHVFDDLWWREYAPPYENLFMRPSGDRRKDSIVKREIFDRLIRDRYDVRFVLDDRQQVVDAWREMGLTVFQVAPGDF